MKQQESLCTKYTNNAPQQANVRYRTDSAACWRHALAASFCGLAMFLLPDRLPNGLGASTARGSAHQMDETPMQSKLPARVPMWIVGVSICLVVASGIVPIVRSIPASYANIPDEGAPSKLGAVPSGSGDAHVKDTQAHPVETGATIARRNAAGCLECGVIASMRQIERSGHVGEQSTVDFEVAGGVFGRASDRAIAPNTIMKKDYEFTVRFRDGSTMVFNEASPRNWRLGSRVIVIGRSNASTD